MTQSHVVGTGQLPNVRVVTLGAQAARVGLVLPAGSPNIRFNGITGARVIADATGLQVKTLTPKKFSAIAPAPTPDIFFADFQTVAVNEPILANQSVEVTYIQGAAGGKTKDAAAIAALIPPA